MAIAGLLSGIGFVRAGLWFLRDAPGAGKAFEGLPAASVTVESFGLDAIVGVRRAELDRRAAWLDARAGTGQAAGLYEGR